MGIKEKANWAEPTTTAENERLPKWLKWVWTGRGLAYSLNVVLMLQLTYYCTDLLEMPTALVGTLLLASKVFDGFTDIVAGFIVDKTNSRWGKARPYDIFIPLMWLGTVLLFSVPDFGIVGKSVYVFIMYAIVNAVCVTFSNSASDVYLGRAIRNEKNRMSVTAFQGGFIMLLSVVAGVALPQMIATIGTEKAGWTLIALIFAVPLAIVGSLRMLFVKEVISSDSMGSKDASKNGLLENLKIVAKNKYIFILAVMVIIANMNTAVATSTATYYFKWIFGNVGLASLISIPQILTPVILIFVPGLTKKIGTGKLLQIGTIMQLAGYGIRLIGGTNLVTIMAGSVLTAVGSIPINILLSIYTLETIDYGEWKSGVRVEGMLACISSFSMKVGSGVGSSLLGILMGAAGYISSTATSQPGSALSMISFLFNGLPCIFMAITLVFALMYQIDKVKPQMISELNARRAA